MPEGTDLQTLRRESRAWNRCMNRDQIKINWKFDRRSARRKFGHKGKYFKRSENWECEIHLEHVEVTWPKSIWRSPPARAAAV